MESIETWFLGSKTPSTGTNQPLQTAKNQVSKYITSYANKDGGTFL